NEGRVRLDVVRSVVHKECADQDPRGEGHVLLLALLDRELGRRAQVDVVRVELELEPQLTGEVLDRADVAEGLRQSVVEERPEGVALDSDEVWERQGFVEVGRGVAFPGSATGQAETAMK